jgi:ABC-type oligopeptide transport system ATPase subunit
MADTESVSPLVKVRDLKMYFPIHAGLFRSHVGDIKAVDGISFDIMPGETLGLVGESGCGKSTVGRSILRLYDVTGGTVEIDGNGDCPCRSRQPALQAADDADDLPGSAGKPQSAHDRGQHHRRTA